MAIDKRYTLPFILAGVLILADQAVKSFIVRHWPQEGTFIKDVFNNDILWIIHVRNKAIAFSLGYNLPENLKTILFIILPLAVFGFLIWYYFTSQELGDLQRWAVAGIIGGGAGNLIDRIFRPDGVVDFISVKFYGLFGFDRWPTFNIADASVVISVFLFLFTVLFASKQPAGGYKHE
ncbi:MAG: signal peptidase II [Spirochaetaceae bacterium]|jgi:signal peptidase II|nr:signal peptidase II [Spirochaetaceae bacterium]